ncbi:triose-phosphate isomerase [Candidatus Woesearchaeota archaeon]|nr:triose-phosphate isomerase [Candidatus Woesearchaeota archaeon]
MALIAANWKMNKTLNEGITFINELNKNIDDVSGNEILICPPFTLLNEISKIKHENLKIGAQNMYYEESGAFTGEISPLMVKEFCEYVIVGHSERRNLFKEPNQWINKKVLCVVNHGLKPILCIGETEEEKKKKKTNEVLETQLKACLKNVSENQIKQVVFAYEPVWAIGTGKNATPQEAQDAHAFIRGLLTDMYSQTTARPLKILYGGSVTPENAAELIQQKDVDGFLVGGASLNVDSFVEIIKKSKK